MEEFEKKLGSALTLPKVTNAPAKTEAIMTISNNPEEKKEVFPIKKNVLLIRPKEKLPQIIKSKLKKIGAIWDEAYQAYAILLERKEEVGKLLSQWKSKIEISEGYIDPQKFSPQAKVRNKKDLQISILHEQIFNESRQLMVEIMSYDPTMSEQDFDEKPATDGKNTYQLQKEAEFYEKRQTLLQKNKELKLLESSVTNMRTKDSPYLLDENGLWFLSGEDDKIWISSPLYITARTRDEKGLNHGKLLEFDDEDGVHHEWAMPMEMLAKDCSEFRSTLMNAGLEISSSYQNRQKLADYVQSSKPSKTMRCVARTGWHKEGFILPDENIGDTGDEKIIIQGRSAHLNSYHIAGTLKEWQETIAELCVGNSRLIFAVCIGFGAPLLHIIEMEGGGFHFRSSSSSGKTTALRVAASLYGDRNFMCKWKSTINGLEAMAYQHNDALLCLDEIGEMSPQDLGNSSYMLANGCGKGRLKSDLSLREPLTWKLLFLSSGEISLAAHMEEAGKKAKTGQEIRLAEIPAGDCKYGMFEDLHGFASGAAFADAIAADAQKYYGVAIREFLKKLTNDLEGAKLFINNTVQEFLSKVVPEKANGQILRVAKRFALVAAAGELATLYNITRVQGQDALAAIGWDEGTAKQAVMNCFYAWLEVFGGCNPHDETELVTEVRYFLEQHGESRFSEWEPPIRDPMRETNNYTPKTYYRAGFRKKTSEGIEFYIFRETFQKDICKGRDLKFVKETLYKHGLLKKDAEGKYTTSAKPPSEAKPQRFYLIVSGQEQESVS